MSTVTVNVNETVGDAGAYNLDFNIVAGTHSIGFKLLMSGGTWYAYQLSYNGNNYLSVDPISAYRDKSFGCGDLHMSNGKQRITIENFQLQPRFVPKEGEAFVAFSDYHNDCVGFFSPAIWGALFVVFLLVSILTVGLTMMLDIKTMDRFDDPKGKTITINAQE